MEFERLKVNLNKIVVHAYLRQHIKQYGPSYIIDIIWIFYCIPNLRIFDSKFNEINTEYRNIKLMRINKHSIFMVTSDDVLLVKGGNNFGQLGIGNNNGMNTFIKHEYFDNTFNSIIISHGLLNGHTFVYINNDKLYGMGYNYDTQIGKKTDEKALSIPVNIEYKFDSELVNISCGFRHTLFLSKLGKVYGAGYNEYGQLGFNDNYEGNYEITLLDQLNGIESIDCCMNSSYCLDKDGILHTFGGNIFGQLGINDKSIRYTYNIHRLKHLPIIRFQSGAFHVGCLTKNHKIYTFGDNAEGQCGDESYKTMNPYNISIPNIMDIKCGGYHTIIKSIYNDYYAFGCNKNNECLIPRNGFGIGSKIKNPTKIPFFYIKKYTSYIDKILDIIPGFEETFIIFNISS